MNDTASVGTLIPLFVAGAVGFASVALPLLVPGNREMRWFTAFNVALVTWLLLLTTVTLGFDFSARDRLWTFSAQLLPGLFLAMAMIQFRPTRAFWQPAVASATGLVVAVSTLVLADRPAAAAVAGFVVTAWHVAGWTTGVLLLLWAERQRRRIPTRPGRGNLRSLVIGLTTVAPFAVVFGALGGDPRFQLVALPLMILGTYVGLLVGVARLRFYDVEVRVARSGEIAADAAETTRVAALGELAISFAHEVRNPLAGVRSLAQRLAEDDIAEESRRRYAAVILEETGRIDRIVTHMLAIGRRRPDISASPAATDLDALFDDLRLLVLTRANRAGVRIETVPCGLTPAVRRDVLAQALLNLLLNGIAHTPRGTRVTLAAEADPAGTTVSVCDEGPGIPPEERDRIFEPFYSSRPGGFGLGLSVVRTVTRDAGWELEVDSATGGGACFRLHIPVHPVDDARSSSPPSPTAEDA